MKESNNKYHIAFCVDNNFSKYIRVAILSIAENNKDLPIHIHIFTDNITKHNSLILNMLTKKTHRNIELEIHYVDDNKIKNLYQAHYTKYTWYRLLIPRILPESIEKILYLDADTLVRGSLKELFETDLKDHAFAGVIEDRTYSDYHYERLNYVKDKMYVCAGVLLLNLKYWREHNLDEIMIDWAEKNRNMLVLPDQDTINFICKDTKILLPLKYNVLQWYFTNDLFYDLHLYEMKESLESPVIIHYAGCVPWLRNTARHMFYKDWWEYNKKLPLNFRIRNKYKVRNLISLKSIIWKIIHNQKWPSYKKEEFIKKIKDYEQR